MTKNSDDLSVPGAYPVLKVAKVYFFFYSFSSSGQGAGGCYVFVILSKYNTNVKYTETLIEC